MIVLFIGYLILLVPITIISYYTLRAGGWKENWSILFLLAVLYGGAVLAIWNLWGTK